MTNLRDVHNQSPLDSYQRSMHCLRSAKQMFYDKSCNINVTVLAKSKVLQSKMCLLQQPMKNNKVCWLWRSFPKDSDI